MEKEKLFPVFVDNIDEEVTTKELRKVFTRCGSVKEVTIISHYGFVNFCSPDDAVASITRLNDTLFHGKKLKVQASEELDSFLKQREEILEQQQKERRKSLEENYHQYSQQHGIPPQHPQGGYQRQPGGHPHHQQNQHQQRH